jgi:hypothetical protein
MQLLVVSSAVCPLAEVNAVAADGFFDQVHIVKLGCVNPWFILDQLQLLNPGQL